MDLYSLIFPTRSHPLQLTRAKSRRAGTRALVSVTRGGTMQLFCYGIHEFARLDEVRRRAKAEHPAPHLREDLRRFGDTHGDPPPPVGRDGHLLRRMDPSRPNGVGHPRVELGEDLHGARRARDAEVAVKPFRDLEVRGQFEAFGLARRELT